MVKSLYAKAVDLPADVRPCFLDQACEGDQTLRAEVESLLRSHEDSEEFLTPPTRTGEFEAKAADEREPHSRIGPYEIVHRLGAGGMGAVYLAKRVDGQVEVQVAAKVVKRGMDSEQILLRFTNERQALADLHHPNIASFLDAGITTDGLPYLIMEYVDGIRIDQYCTEHELDVHARLRLFRQVCDAVKHAHRNLFVHRDLKPSNILITEEGEPKLLDFGLAKVLTPGSLDPTRSITSTEQRFLTPDYASPEQILGKHTNTTSDVYSLGVLLYKLLTGSPPYRFQRLPQREIERILLEQLPPAPSGIVAGLKPIIEQEDEEPEAERGRAFFEGFPHSESTPDRLARHLRGDLDNILLKAIQQDPDRRYSSVEQLADDIGRYLDGLPVLARKDTITYRAVKFYRRHRSMVISAAAIGLVLTAGIVVIGWQNKIANDARERENRARLKENALQATLASIMYTADPGAGEPAGAIDTLYERFRTKIDRGLDPEPEVDAQILEQFGRIYRVHGRYNEAARILRRAVGLRQTLPRATSRPEMATSLHLLGAVLIDVGEFDEAENVLRAAMTIRTNLFGEKDNRVAGVMDNLTLLYAHEGRYEEGQEMFARSEAIYTETLEFSDLHLLEQSLKVANIMLDRGDLDIAEAVHTETLREVRERLGEEDEYLVGLLLIEARICRARGDMERSASVHNDLITRLERMHRHRSHPDLASAYASAGETQELLGNRDEAVDFYAKAVDMQRLIFGQDHPITLETADKLDELLRVPSP